MTPRRPTPMAPAWEDDPTDVYEHLRGPALDEVGAELGVYRGGDGDPAYLVRVRSAARRVRRR